MWPQILRNINNSELEKLVEYEIYFFILILS